MNTYRICITREGRPPVEVTTMLFGDHAAVRRAQSLSRAAALVEVWRGPTCIYSNAPGWLLAS